MSSPKFRKGQIVYFNTERRNKILESRKELLNNYSSSDIGEMPTGKLFIDDSPRKNKNNEWTYQYVYGFCGNHEGYANESDLVSKEEFFSINK
jgi:hypothetical protein